MQGRCDNDPLDSADDVCDICGGEFCETCLIYPRGRKKTPVCKGCALNNSGLRGGARVDRRNDRRTAKKRREELAQTKGEREYGGFVFFDEEENHDYDLPEVAEAQPAEKKVRRRRVSIGRQRKDDQVTTVEATEAPEEEPESLSTIEASSDPDQTSVPAPTRDPNEVLAELPNSRPTAASPPTATELLAKLREDEPAPLPVPAPVQAPLPMSAGDPVAAAPAADPFDPTIDPFALAPSEAGVGATTTIDPFDTPQQAPVAFEPPAPPPVEAPPPTPVAAAEADPFAPTPTAASSVTASSPAPTPEQPRPSLLSRLDSDAPVSAPQKAPMPAWQPPVVTPEPRTGDPEGPMEPALLGHINSTQPTTQPEPAVQQAPMAQPEPAVQQAPIAQPEPSALPVPRPASSSGSADKDEDGNWIPPALRGMAPKAQRDAETLPRRR